MPLDFNDVSKANRDRARRWHHGFPDNQGGWTGADWSNAMCGEAGETANVVKKLRRHDFGLTQANGFSRNELLGMLATEIGDTFIYLDLLAQFYGLNTSECVVDTFNRVSEREGFPDRIEHTPHEPGAPVLPTPEVRRTLSEDVEMLLWDGSKSMAAEIDVWTMRKDGRHGFYPYADVTPESPPEHVRGDNTGSLWVAEKSAWVAVLQGHRVARKADGSGFYPVSPDELAAHYEA